MATSTVPWVKVVRDPQRYGGVMRRSHELGQVRNAADVYRLLGPAMAEEDQEVACVVLVDVHGYCRGVQEIARGARDRVGFELPDALRAAQITGCRYLVLTHNHPSGSAVPSDADGELTLAVEAAAYESGLVLLDHVVLGLNEYYSFREQSLFRVERTGRIVRVR